MTGGRRFLGSDTSEVELLSAVSRGELDALAEIYRRHGAAVLAAARAVTDDSTEAEAITAEVFVELWDRPESAALPRDGLGPFLVSRAVAMVAGEQRSGS